MTCRAPDCDRKKVLRGLCDGHYRQDKRGEELRPIGRYTFGGATGECAFDGCERHARSIGLCGRHYAQQHAGKPLTPIRPRDNDTGSRMTCLFDGCGRRAMAKGWCSGHYRQVKNGKPPSSLRVTDGTGWVTPRGYRMIRVPSPDGAGRGQRMFEHKYVMEQKLGRMLVPGENVHHMNGDKLDNRPENLELWVIHQPTGARPADLVAWAKEILARYEPEVEA